MSWRSWRVRSTAWRRILRAAGMLCSNRRCRFARRMRSLRRGGTELETMLETIPNGVATLSPERSIMLANRAFSEMLDPGGQRAFLGASLEKVTPPELAEVLDRLIRRSHRMVHGISGGGAVAARVRKQICWGPWRCLRPRRSGDVSITGMSSCLRTRPSCCMRRSSLRGRRWRGGWRTRSRTR